MHGGLSSGSMIPTLQAEGQQGGIPPPPRHLEISPYLPGSQALTHNRVPRMWA